MASNPITFHQPMFEQYRFDGWTITGVKGYILKSEGAEREEFESHLQLPHVPDMIFAKNGLRLEHDSGFGIEFNALDALKLVDPEHDLLKVAATQAWTEARAGSEFIKKVIKPFDWTFTTKYNGTLLGNEDFQLQAVKSDEMINVEKLKQRDKIHFYADIVLFEDELSDNGCSLLNVKIRVMPTCFFILQRFYLRVDRVLIRTYDTRIYHEIGWEYLLREYSEREDTFEDIKVPANVSQEPQFVADHLTLRHRHMERLQFPNDWQNRALSHSAVSYSPTEKRTATKWFSLATLHDELVTRSAAIGLSPPNCQNAAKFQSVKENCNVKGSDIQISNSPQTTDSSKTLPH